MSYWEQNWRRNLKLITVDETPELLLDVAYEESARVGLEPS